MMPEKKARWAMTLISAVLTILFFKAGLGVNSIYPAAAFGAIIGSILSGRLWKEFEKPCLFGNNPL